METACSGIFQTPLRLQGRGEVFCRCLILYGCRNDAPKRPTASRFRTITSARLPGSLRSYGAKLRQKTKLGVRKMRVSSVLIALFLAGCSAPSPYTQTVAGALYRGSLPVAGVPVRFVLSPAAKAQPCSPVVAEAVTNQNGQFALSTQYAPSQIESYAVLVQHHAVCVQLDGQWSPIWEFTTGPAMRSITLRCLQNENRKVSCER